MKKLLVATVFVALLALAGCGNEDWMRPSGPERNGHMTTVALPGGGKMVTQEVGNEIRVTIFNADGKILSETTEDTRGDQIYQRPGAPASTQVMPRRSGPQHREPLGAASSSRRCKPCAHGFVHWPRPGSPCWCEWTGESGEHASAGSRCKPCRQGYSHNPKPGQPCWCSPD